jgi:hypothetical protein
MKLSPLFSITMFLAAALGFVGGAPASAQTAAEQSSLSTAHFSLVQGIVVKEPGSEPLKKAIIELIAESQSGGSNYTAVTGADGRFQIENVMPGRYRMFVERTGYLESSKNHRPSEGRLLSLSAGQEMKDIVIRLQATAVIEGAGFGPPPDLCCWACSLGTGWRRADQRSRGIPNRQSCPRKLFRLRESAAGLQKPD